MLFHDATPGFRYDFRITVGWHYGCVREPACITVDEGWNMLSSWDKDNEWDGTWTTDDKVLS